MRDDLKRYAVAPVVSSRSTPVASDALLFARFGRTNAAKKASLGQLKCALKEQMARTEKRREELDALIRGNQKNQESAKAELQSLVVECESLRGRERQLAETRGVPSFRVR